MDCNYATKRKAEEGMDSICRFPTKLKLADAAPVEGVNVAAARHGVEAPKKKVKRLSQRKIDYILSRTKRPPYCSPDKLEILCRPGPNYSQAEADEYREMLLGWNESREAQWKMISEAQQWVRAEYAAKGFVEVDEDHYLFHGRDAEVEDEFDNMMPDAELDDPEEEYAEEDYAEEEDDIMIC